LELTDDDFANTQDLVLASVPANNPLTSGWLPYNGDYDMLVTVEKNFYGIFTASNIPDLANFPNGVTYQRSADFNNHKLLDLNGNEIPISIDCFFFKVTR
jgi:hypothetical protein